MPAILGIPDSFLQEGKQSFYLMFYFPLACLVLCIVQVVLLYKLLFS